MALRTPTGSKRRKPESNFPDHSDDLVRLKRIRGQVEGIERMIAENRYCPDIINQIKSATAALKAVEGLVLERHLRHCVNTAIQARDPQETEAKVNEIIALYNRG